jgi:methionine-S-sulfoxide reductase
MAMVLQLWVSRVTVLAAVLTVGACAPNLYLAKPAGYRAEIGTTPGEAGKGTPLKAAPRRELALFAGGDFRDLEARFRALDGVTATAVGYMGGDEREPVYERVQQGKTGHALCVLVEFDPRKTSYENLLSTFFRSHDPTRVNSQGDLKGSFVRSAIFTFSSEQEEQARKARAELSKASGKPIVTEIEKQDEFWLAEPEYQQAHERKGSLPRPEPAWR